MGMGLCCPSLQRDTLGERDPIGLRDDRVTKEGRALDLLTHGPNCSDS
jgi:hypothetical protein